MLSIYMSGDVCHLLLFFFFEEWNGVLDQARPLLWKEQGCLTTCTTEFPKQQKPLQISLMHLFINLLTVDTSLLSAYYISGPGVAVEISNIIKSRKERSYGSSMFSLSKTVHCKCACTPQAQAHLHTNTLTYLITPEV